MSYHKCCLHSTVPNTNPDVICFYDEQGVFFSSLYVKDLNAGDYKGLEKILDKVYNTGKVKGEALLKAKLRRAEADVELARSQGYIAGVKDAKNSAKVEEV